MTLPKITVAKYLQLRLEELGLDKLFGVAGNYTAPFLNTIVEDPSAKISIVGNTNEINAGHCADAYARLKGIGAVGVTYGVGAFSVLNPVAGSYVEHNPVLVINGAPTTAEQSKSIGEGLLASHMTGDMYSNINVFRQVTVAAEQVMSGNEAPYKIDAVLNAMISYGKPAYLEVFEDVWRMECDRPIRRLTPKYGQGCEATAQDAATATADLIEAHDEPIFWAGVEIQRKQLQGAFLDLVESTKIEFTTSIMGKSIVSEDHPLFKGVFNGNASPSDVHERFTKAGAKIGLGAWTTGKNLGGFNIWDTNTVLANNGGVRVGAKFFPNVGLGQFMEALKKELLSRREKFKAFSMDASLGMQLKMKPRALEAAPTTMTYDLFFHTMDGYLTNDHAVVVDSGFPLLGAQGLHRGEPNTFIAQASWLSIGYSVPAAIGIKCALPEKRVIVFVGDGAFQETCQAVSTQHHQKQNTVVFVLDNKIYGIEQLLVNPNPFRGEDKVDYPQADLNTVYPYNKLNNWKYAKLTDAFGGSGLEVNSLAELKAALETIKASPEENFIVHVHLPETDIPESIAYRTKSPGEDETLNPDWSLC
jgi:indolepyruvate decarboxylase